MNEATEELTDPDKHAGFSDLSDLQSLTDSENAKRLRLERGDAIRYCSPWKTWLAWDGKRWELDQRCRVDAMAKEVAAAIFSEVYEADFDARERARAMRFAQRSNNQNGIAAMIKLAQSEPGIAILPDELNRDPHLLNVQNGTLDLRTGDLRSHSQSDLLTQICPVEYDPRATCPGWENFILQVMGGDRELAAFLQRLVGYSLSGEVAEHILPIHYGEGSNGKSTFFSVIHAMLGNDYAMKAGNDLLVKRSTPSHSTFLMDLHGKRFVYIAEPPEGQIDEALAKDLTGGGAIRGRRMRQDSWEFQQSHLLNLAANHKPKIVGDDHGTWRRLLLIPWTVRFWDSDRGETGDPGLKCDKGLKDRLLSELPGILTWAYAGYKGWRDGGLRAPQCVTKATEEYRSDMDVKEAWFVQCVVEEGEYWTPASEIFESYRRFCRPNSATPMSQTQFGKWLKAKKQLESKRGRSGLVYRVRLRVHEESDHESV